MENFNSNVGLFITEASMKRVTLNYQADGLQMKSELLFEPSAQPKTGILVFPEAYGLNKHALSRAEKLVGLVTWR